MKRIMSTTNRVYTRWLAPVILILIIVAIFIGYRSQSKRNNSEVFVEVKAIQTKQGWGYDILTDGKIYIHQEFIPAIQGKHSFRTEADALKVGRKVISKMALKQMPNITIEELREMGILADSLVYNK
jgi:hypothetical protein